jgi:pimeloyl-ACP methyl ester carboxylesterase
MVSQMRSLLHEYGRQGGLWREEVIEGAGHTPFLEKPEAFRSLFLSFLADFR